MIWLRSTLAWLAPGLLGVVLLLASGCDQAPSRQDWSGEEVRADAEPPAAEPSTASPSPRAAESQASTTTPEAVRFISYNVENWLTMDRYVDGKRINGKPKPEKERQAVVTILARHQPDILGLCEIGSRDDLADLQQRLAAAGIDLPHAHHTGGGDPTRRLAMLSRYPIIETYQPPDLEYQLAGRTFEMGRGILDVTLDTPRRPVRFLGAHLKSKREIPEADQEMMRRAEAHLLREHADRLLRDDPDLPLIVYGDMNDSRNASALRTLRGPRDGPLQLNLGWLKDSRGDTWTHFWSYQDIYSRFDYVLVSNSMVEHVRWDDCRVLDDPEWADASDHRALLMVFD